jgi:hypothetical protein
MKKQILLLWTLLICSSLNLYAKSLGAHVHGLVNLDIAIDKKQMLVMLKTPSESFFGFEYKAKTTKEKLLVKQVKVDWTKNLLNYLGKDNLQDCKISSSEWVQKFNGKYHSNIIAEAYINCTNPLKSRSLSISFKQNYNDV